MKNSKPHQNSHYHKRGKNSDSKQSNSSETVASDAVGALAERKQEGEPNSPSPVVGKEGLLRSVLGLKSALGIPIGPSNPANVVSGSISPSPAATPHAPPPGFTAPVKPISAAPPGLSPAPMKFTSHSEHIPSLLNSNNVINNEEMNRLSANLAPLLPSSSTDTSNSASFLLAPANSMPPGLQSTNNNNHFLLSSYLPMNPISSSNELNTVAGGNESITGGDFGLALSTMRALNIDDSSTSNKDGATASYSLPPPPGFSVTPATVPPISTTVTPTLTTSSAPISSDKQKAAALLSLMKSRVGDMTVKLASPTAAMAKKLETTVVVEDTVRSSGTVPNMDINDIIDDKNDALGANNSTNNAKKVLTYRIVRNQTAFLHVKVRNYKTKEESRIPVGYYFRPGNGMTVEWKIPASIADRYLQNDSSSGNGNNNGNSSLVIGLLRYGTVTNSGCLIAKNIHLSARQRWVDNVTNEVYYIGDMPFFAPKSAGQFVYRLFDSSTKESAFDTLGTSMMFHVVLVDQDIVVNLPVILESVDKKYVKSTNNDRKANDASSTADVENANNNNSNLNFAKGIAQLSQLIRGVKSCAPEFTGQVAPLLNRAVECVVEEIQRTLTLLDEGGEKKKLAAATSTTTTALGTNATASGTSSTATTAVEDTTKLETAAASMTTQPAGAQSDEDVEFWMAYRHAAKVHLDAFDCFVLLQEKRNVWYLLSEKLKNTLVYQQRLFCPILRRFFSSLGDMAHRRLESLQFVPAQDVAGRVLPPPVQQAMSHSIVQKAAALLPHADFFVRREKIRELIERKLYEAKVMPEKSCLALYGSSANYFGKEDADLDMCLVLSEDNLTNTNKSRNPLLHTHREAEEEEKQQQEQLQQQRLTILENIAQALSVHLGMTQVSTRLTARIPIVEFHDPLLNLDGDISLHNSLALCNTKLLRVYAEIDPRVRCLAYIIKHWAKARHLNSPQDGTLSSYGFVLTLIHFLQRRPVPILPNLQQLPPYWRGGPVHASQLAACSVLATSVDGSQCNVYFLQPDMQQLQLLKRMAEENKESVAQLLLEYFRYFAWLFDTRHEVVSIRKTVQPQSHNNNNNNGYAANAFNSNSGNATNSNNMTKLDKYEESAWFHSDVLSIEDPFEIGYDVAHVIKATQMSYMRKEFLRAYTLACRTVSPPLDSPLSPAVANTAAVGAPSLAIHNNNHSNSSSVSGAAASLYLPGPDSLPNYVSPMNFVDVLCEPCEPPPFVGRRKASVSITEASAFGSTSLLQMLAASVAPSSAAAAVLSEVIPHAQAK